MTESDSSATPFQLDALLPPQMARQAEAIGERKSRMSWSQTFTLAILAGAFIAWGAEFSLTATAGAALHWPYGAVRVLAGLVFSLGLILVVVGGAELFTGNNLIVMAWASRRVTTTQLLRNWGLVYLGNFVGAIATAALIFVSGQYAFGAGAVGQNALTTAAAKCSLGFGQAVALGIGCNALVCMAVWLCYGARTVSGKILAVLFPVAAFVACGMEHSIANMFFIPLGIFIKQGAPAEFWSLLGQNAGDYASLTWRQFLLANLLPVTLGNIIGGAVMVGMVYWFVYLRPREGERG